MNRDTTGTGASYTSLVAPFDAYVVNPTQASVPVNWQISFTGSTGGSTNIHEIAGLKVCAALFLPPTATSTAAAFNAIDSALPNTKQNALFGHIYMKQATMPFTLNVAALLPAVGGVSQGVNTVYASGGNKTVTVRLIDDSQAGGSCNAPQAACAACSKTVVATNTMTFTGADGGFKTSPAFTVNGAYKRLIVQMNDGTTTGCSTDSFAVRPAFYALTSSVSSATKAGASFTITATMKDKNNNTISGTPGAPTLDNTKAPTAGGNQTLLQQSWNTGANFGTFIYNDVGTFSLVENAIYDPSFGNAAGEAQDKVNGDCNPGSGSPYAPNTCYGYASGSCTNATPWNPDASGKYACDIGSSALSNVGRFYPDHYEASVAMTQACAADGFSYMGQPFSMTASPSGVIQVKALAAGQTFATAPGLPSYTGTYTPRANVWFGAQNGTGSTTDLIRCISSTPNTTANRCNLTTLPIKTHLRMHGPRASIRHLRRRSTLTRRRMRRRRRTPLGARTTASTSASSYPDSDGSTLTIPGGRSFTLNSDLYHSINSSAAKMRYGRMRIQNATGSDQVPLLVPILLEYWTGTGWAPNALDTTCTSLVTTPTAFGGNPQRTRVSAPGVPRPLPVVSAAFTRRASKAWGPMRPRRPTRRRSSPSVSAICSWRRPR